MHRWRGLGRDICSVDSESDRLLMTEAKTEIRMRAKSSGGNDRSLRFYQPSAQLRAAMSRAHERGVSWQRVEEILKDGEDGPEDAIRLLDGLKPLATLPDDIDEMPTSPSLDEKREAWRKLNDAFK